MSLSEIGGGVCAPSGFRAAGVSCGIKRSGGLDLSLVVSDTTAAVAGVFTTNQAAAAPVVLSRHRAATGKARGVVVNSGCANACTGEKGYLDALAMAVESADAVGASHAEMLVCSTGLIGSFLPMGKVRAGIKSAAMLLGPDDGPAEQAIMTTDTRPKRAAFAHSSGWKIAGMAKGAGMIAPNMATMLAFITTDAVVDNQILHEILVRAAGSTFNQVTIDGDSSTNDTVLAFANGASGIAPPADALEEAVHTVCSSLADQIVADGEGTTKVVRIVVGGAESQKEARDVARTIAESILVKTALYGADANWGRIAAAVGRSGANYEFAALSIAICGAQLLDKGNATGDKVVAQARTAMRATEIDVLVDLGHGNATAEVLTTDLSEKYVELNAAYE